MNRRAVIKAAFQRLPLLEEKATLVQGAVNMVASVDCRGPGTIPRKFSLVGRRQSRKELEKLARLAKELAEHIDTLHQPAVLALADVGLHPARLELLPILREIAKQAPRADLNQIPEAVRGGNPHDARAHAVGDMLAYYYCMLTGKEPSRQIDAYAENATFKGPYMNLVNEVFKALGLDSNAEYIAREAIARRRKARRKPPRS